MTLCLSPKRVRWWAKRRLPLSARGSTGSGWSSGEGVRRRASRSHDSVSESLIVGGWRVHADTASEPVPDLGLDDVVVDEALPRRRYRRGALVRRTLLAADVIGLMIA